jgi:hypothetical protein
MVEYSGFNFFIYFFIFTFFLFSLSKQNTLIEDCTFVEQESLGDGGMVCAVDGGDIFLNNTIMRKGRGARGGALYLENVCYNQCYLL